MTGSARETRPGKWELRVYVGRRDGKPVHAQRTVAATSRRAAEKALAAFVAEQANARPAAGTVDALLDRWLAHIEAQGRAVSTLTDYRSKLALYVRPAIGGMQADTVTGAHLDAIYTKMRGQGLSPQTIHHVHAIIRAALHQGVRWDLLGRNVAANATAPVVGQREQRPPTAEQVRAALDVAAEMSPQAHVLVRLAATTGARRGELAALTWSRVDLAGGTVLIDSALDRDLSRKPTKNRTTRRTRLDPGTVAALAAEHQRQADIAAEHMLPFDDGCPVIARWPGLPYSPSWMTRTWGAVSDAAELPAHVRLHDLRHYVATSLLAAGVDVATVAAHVGHRDGTTTLRVYAHGTKPGADRAAVVLGELLG